MKQKAAIEKTYAESLHKLSSVFGSKKIASKVGLDSKDGEHSNDNTGGERFQYWHRDRDEIENRE